MRWIVSILLTLSLVGLLFGGDINAVADDRPDPVPHDANALISADPAAIEDASGPENAPVGPEPSSSAAPAVSPPLLPNGEQPLEGRDDSDGSRTHTIIAITVADMVDGGLADSLRRRTTEAIDRGASYIVYDIDTFGGRVDSAIDIWNYFMYEVNPKVETVAYVRTKAISAGALISVACEDIIMKRATTIGDCAPIMMGGTLEGVEREKMESPLRSYFENAASENGYPALLCKAMVSMRIVVYRVKNLDTGDYEFFDEESLPEDESRYDLANKELVDGEESLLTLTADKAERYGLARAVVEDMDRAVAFLEQRDNVAFRQPVPVLQTNWSEQLVRWLTSPQVAGILFMVALLGIYAELNSPGVGLPGAVAVIALVIMFGSKYLIGLANWWEIAVFALGVALVLIEIFVIPGFGVAGVSGIIFILVSMAAMMVGNPPDELPIPTGQFDWDLLERNVRWFLVGIVGFFVGVFYLSKYLPRVPYANRLVLVGPGPEPLTPDQPGSRSGSSSHASDGGDSGGSTAAGPDHADRAAAEITLQGIGQGMIGRTTSPCRPSGSAKIDGKRVSVVSRGELIEAGTQIKVVAIEGNRIVVRECPGGEGAAESPS